MKKILFVGLTIAGLIWAVSFSQTVAVARDKESAEIVISQVRVITAGDSQKQSDGKAQPTPTATPMTLHVTQFHLFDPEYIKKVLEALNPGK